MTIAPSHVREILADAVIEDPEAGLYRANRRIFTDEEIFELEMAHIFEGNWIYLAHESQVPNPGDYFTTYIGRQPVVITRDRDGELHCLINACAHRGAMLCRRKVDNRLTLTCPFHGWTFRDGSGSVSPNPGRSTAVPAARVASRPARSVQLVAEPERPCT
jgi:benzoate/toluate 1,2-dioxygenase subunit alpha